MAIPTREEFLARFPELAIHDGAVVDDALAAAGRRCPDLWGEQQYDGASYYAAHLISSRVREIGASIQMAAGTPPAKGSTGTDTSFYGQQFEEIRALLPTYGAALV
jgi:hypothetical protein